MNERESTAEFHRKKWRILKIFTPGSPQKIFSKFPPWPPQPTLKISLPSHLLRALISLELA